MKYKFILFSPGLLKSPVNFVAKHLPMFVWDED